MLALKLMMIPVCPRLLNMITDFVLFRFLARASEDLSAIEVFTARSQVSDTLQQICEIRDTRFRQ